MNSGSDAKWSKVLKELYPFLQPKEGETPESEQVLLESISRKAAESVSAKQRFFQDNAAGILLLARSVAEVYGRKGRMFSMGNGGSSCDAAHFAVEFQHPVTTGRQALAAVNLGNDTAMLSAVANDVGFEHVFVRQLEAQARKGDGLIGFSTSGNSKNLMQAFRKGRELGLMTAGITGGDGGAMASSDLLDHCLVVRTDSIHRVQEVHVTLYHIIWDLVHTILAANCGNTSDSNQ